MITISFKWAVLGFSIGAISAGVFLCRGFSIYVMIGAGILGIMGGMFFHSLINEFACECKYCPGHGGEGDN